MNTSTTEVMQQELLQTIIEPKNHVGWKGTLEAT